MRALSWLLAPALLAHRALRALRYVTALNYSWHLAWVKAGY